MLLPMHIQFDQGVIGLGCRRDGVVQNIAENSGKVSIREIAQDTAANIRMEGDIFFLTLTLIAGKNDVQHMVVANADAFRQIRGL